MTAASLTLGLLVWALVTGMSVSSLVVENSNTRLTFDAAVFTLLQIDNKVRALFAGYLWNGQRRGWASYNVPFS